MIEIDIADDQNAIRLDLAWLRALAEHALREESVSHAQLSITLVDNQTIHQLNRQYLRHDYPTDVITFPLSDGVRPLIGEIVVGAEYALGQAEEYRWPAAVETGLYVVHGVLHLCGYDDHDDSQAARMRRRQFSILRRFLQSRGEDADFVPEDSVDEHVGSKPCR